MVPPYYLLTSEDLDIGITDEREQVTLFFFFFGLTSFNIIISRYIHLLGNFIISVFFTDVLYSIVCMYDIFLAHFSVEGCLVCFHYLHSVTRAAMNVDEQVSVEQDVESPGNMPRSGISEP